MTISEIHTPEGICPVVAHVIFVLNNVKRMALVTRHIGAPRFDLWFATDKDGNYKITGSVSFESGKVLVKYVRKWMRDRYEGYMPVIDDLDRLLGMNPSSFVPACYQNKHLMDEQKESGTCLECSWRSDCASQVTPIEPIESDESFMERLRSKIKDKWGE